MRRRSHGRKYSLRIFVCGVASSSGTARWKYSAGIRICDSGLHLTGYLNGWEAFRAVQIQDWIGGVADLTGITVDWCVGMSVHSYMLGRRCLCLRAFPVCARAAGRSAFSAAGPGIRVCNAIEPEWTPKSSGISWRIIQGDYLLTGSEARPE